MLKQIILVFSILILILSLSIVSSSTLLNKKYKINTNSGSGSDSDSNEIYNYVMSTITTTSLSNICPNTNVVDYYKVSQCVEGFMYECNTANKTVDVTLFEDFNCEIFGKKTSYPFGCSEMYNSTYYYTCVAQIEPMENSYVVSSFNDKDCNVSQIYHQKHFKLNNCNAEVSPILYGSCNSTYFSYTFYNDTSCHNSEYSLADQLNTCINSQIFDQSYLSQCYY